MLLPTHHLLLTTRTENRPGDLSLSLSLRKIVSWSQGSQGSEGSQVLCLRCGGVGVSRGRQGQHRARPGSVPAVTVRLGSGRAGDGSSPGWTQGAARSLLSGLSSLVSGPAPLPARELRSDNNREELGIRREEKRNVMEITTVIMATQCRTYQDCLYRAANI